MLNYSVICRAWIADKSLVKSQLLHVTEDWIILNAFESTNENILN